MRTVHDLMDLSGRVALVTGGAGHIGSAMAEALAEWGADIVLLDQDDDACRRAAEPIWKVYGSRCHWWAVDLETATRERLDSMLLEVSVDFAQLDILVNCAAYLSGPGLDVPFEQQTAEDWDRSMAVNLRAAFLLTQACHPWLKNSSYGGSVINVGSIYGLVGPDMKLYEGTGMGNSAAYATSKGGLLQLTRWLATTLAPEVRVNAICPGGVWRGQDATFVDRYCARTPLGRMATEEDMKGVTAWLASDASAYVTGAVIPIDGGWVAW